MSHVDSSLHHILGIKQNKPYGSTEVKINSWPLLAVFITADVSKLVIIDATIDWKLLSKNNGLIQEVIITIRRLTAETDEVIYSVKESTSGFAERKRTVLSHVDYSFRPNQENTYVLSIITLEDESTPKVLNCQFSSHTIKKI